VFTGGERTRSCDDGEGLMRLHTSYHLGHRGRILWSVVLTQIPPRMLCDLITMHVLRMSRCSTDTPLFKDAPCWEDANKVLDVPKWGVVK
jgi:hypothetical protein